ncbi:23S rRNA (uracil(1939)-C(5))-methyltransferase RlmD [Chengkuizengella marina]|uniref:23S rRNA (Uracil(1939)-C(5))-methyltransferase RlmD n=1 Tax=Chengkuizengella marina TaxID=2507566 RepID=A0A6N9Q2R8_9BACL|nr:23S rRNA (uracil(1939)-C(5))-methyltransferase RlmD [Chengkuizengella marina]NBI29058.1 23S rRNA (uracil(1939)-C(5))-methyltransferase RlmD [Chengkuizengella marina]
MEKNKKKFITTSAAQELKTGELLVVTIKKIGINGEGVGYYKRKAVFVEGALPDEVVKAKVIQIQPNFIRAELVEIEQKSEHRIKPHCSIYEECGGCQLQHLDYKEQLRVKEDIIRESFNRYTDKTKINIRPVIGMEDPWGYRNKAQYQVGFHKGSVQTGLYSARSHKLVDISGCPIHHPTINQIVEKTKRIVQELRIPIYDEKNNKGILKTIVVRTGFKSNENQLTLVTTKEQIPKMDQLIHLIRENIPEVSTIAQNINSAKTSIIFGSKTNILWGRRQIKESLGNVNFSLSPRAFFQLNPEQTIKLYNTVKKAADIRGHEKIVDAYCGTGTISLWLAPYVKEVRGIEEIPEAINDAKKNAKLSGIDNAQFYVGKSENLLPKWMNQGFRPDVIVVDPPRTGCDYKLLQAVVRAKTKKFIYVSCNPSTLAKDSSYLLRNGYHLKWIQPVDMFPNTSQIESVAVFIKK